MTRSHRTGQGPPGDDHMGHGGWAVATSSAYGSVYFTSAMSTTYQGPSCVSNGRNCDLVKPFNYSEYLHLALWRLTHLRF